MWKVNKYNSECNGEMIRKKAKIETERHAETKEDTERAWNANNRGAYKAKKKDDNIKCQQYISILI